MPIIKLEALDTLFFRDGKPFSMGEDTFAEGIFPPPPSVIYGALRTAYFAENGGFEKANTAEDPTKDLEIRGVYLGIGEESKNDIYLPLPLDIVELKNKTKTDKRKEKIGKFTTVFLSENVEHKIISSNSVTNYFDYKGNSNEYENIEAIDAGLLHEDLFIDYLENRKNDVFVVKKINFHKSTEFKIGIGRNDDTKIATDGLLYRVGMSRIPDLKIFVIYDFKNNFELEKGFLKLGGEGKIVKYENVESIRSFNFHSTQFTETDTSFKLYLKTPTFFRGGWKPSWIDDTMQGIGEAEGIQLVNAVIGKAIPIGGFDMVKKQPKAMLKAVPAGSVYYFEKTEKSNKSIPQIIEKLFFNEQIKYQHSICEFTDDYKKQGFGLYFLAK